MRHDDCIGWLSTPENELVYREAWFISTLRPYLAGVINKHTLQSVAEQSYASSASATIVCDAEDVWAPGRNVDVMYSGCHRGTRWSGSITRVTEYGIYVDDKLCSRTNVTVLLP